MSENEYIDMFELKAMQHRQILHDPEGLKAFFYIESPDELTEFDDALRTVKKRTVMLLVANNGEFNDNETNNYTEELNGQLYILIKKTAEQTIRQINTMARQVLLDVLARVRKENPKIFRLNKLQYQKVGPMNNEWYGYTAALVFTCPFGFVINGANWVDKA